MRACRSLKKKVSQAKRVRKDPVLEAWIEEAKRRRDELRTGKVKPLTYQEVMGKYI